VTAVFLGYQVFPAICIKRTKIKSLTPVFLGSEAVVVIQIPSVGLQTKPLPSTQRFHWTVSNRLPDDPAFAKYASGCAILKL